MSKDLKNAKIRREKHVSTLGLNHMLAHQRHVELRRVEHHHRAISSLQMHSLLLRHLDAWLVIQALELHLTINEVFVILGV